MATWVKDPQNGYIQVGTIQRAYVSKDPEYSQGLNIWFILGDCGARSFVLKTGFASQLAAQTALDNAITNLGGSI